MKLALLGDDAETLHAARAVAASGQHALVWICDCDPAAAKDLVRLAPTAKWTGDWESLLSGQVADAVLVGRGPDQERRADQLRKLVQAGVPTVVVHPAVDSMLVYYELEMIREQVGGKLVPLLTSRRRAAVVHALECLSTGESALGPVEQLALERQMPDRTENSVWRQLARDVDLAQVFAGELNQVSALAPAEAERAYANLGVQWTGPAGVVVRWTVGPVVDRPGGKLTLLGRGGRLVIDMPDEGSWTVTDGSGAEAKTRSFSSDEAQTAALLQIQETFEPTPPTPSWADAARTLELADAVARSLAKGRTITLYDEDYSEQHTFKGKMAAAGCSLLMLSLALFLLGAVAAKVGVPLAGYTPWLIAAALLGFLLLQTLTLVFPAESRAPHEAHATGDSHGR
ncbi:MAG: hypothetical protein JNM56_35465, partial [Planctomycetia bacterium]|nr:hypothetical protein [Planctomycetia bacterium]